ncbi:MAG: hypothetical protein LBD45_01925 [Bacteroidales bacterium]|jgi:hypothetical protein|nr:hypothetical protein [Bacteroidales bacterium]
MTTIYKLKSISAVFLLTLFLSYWSVCVFCMHTHTINGKLVTHAHPFPKTPHQHSATDYVLIDNLTHYNTLPDIIADNSVTVFRKLLENITTFVSEKIYYCEHIYCPLRAPPFC